MQLLENKERIDFAVGSDQANPALSIDYLFGMARGQMFGVLECRDEQGGIVFLKAFSGQYNGIWTVDGWVPPVLDPARFDDIVADVDGRIKALGEEIDALPEGSDRHGLIRERKGLSQQAMRAIHDLYTLTNFRSEIKPLSHFFPNGTPTGAGDCCAPKLLNHAAQNRLTPLSLAEFFWGRGNRAKTRQHGNFYASCEEKCQPILGFMLCGIEGVNDP